MANKAGKADDLVKGMCFVAGTKVSTATGAIEIEQIRVGDRVLTTDENDDKTNADENTWRKVILEMSNPESAGDTIAIETLVSGEWMQSVGCLKGEWIWFVLDEMGLEGWAKVLDIQACPEIKPGKGKVVLTTVTHLNSFVMKIKLVGEDTLIEPTDRHRLFSVTRNDWIPAVQLTVGELLKTKDGSIEIESITQRLGTQRVYNIEVETQHCYYVGNNKILSHNVNKCAQPPSLTPPDAGRKGAFKQAKRNNDIPITQQPDRVLPNVDKRGNPQAGRIYEFDTPQGTKSIRNDIGGHKYLDDPSQNRGSHFNDDAGNHYDY